MAAKKNNKQPMVEFAYVEAKRLRCGMTNGRAWYVAQDVCDILGIANVSDAISRLADDEKGIVSTDTLGGSQNMLVVYESGLYHLIFQSRKPEAEAFRRWVCGEVLPSIRTTGSYHHNKRGRNYVAKGKDPLWIKEREEGIENRKDFTSILKVHGITQPKHYGTCTNAIYGPILGCSAATYRSKNGLSNKANLRDHLERKKLAQTSLAEITSAERIEANNRRGVLQCAATCAEVSRAIVSATTVTQLASPKTDATDLSPSCT